MAKLERLFVWGGGAMFVLSLAACTYFYIVAWASPASRGNPWPAVTINMLAFAVFALHHSLFARDLIKKSLAAVVAERLLRSVYVWTASILLLCVLVLWRPVAGDVYEVTGWRAVAHASVQLGGIWLIVRSVARIDPLELAGIRPASGRDSLQIAGPYRWVRHPLYLGWILAVFGAGHMTGDRLAFAAISTAYLIVAIPWEERSLARFFGEPYARYQRAVPWRVIPYVY